MIRLYNASLMIFLLLLLFYGYYYYYHKLLRISRQQQAYQKEKFGLATWESKVFITNLPSSAKNLFSHSVKPNGSKCLFSLSVVGSFARTT